MLCVVSVRYLVVLWCFVCLLSVVVCLFGDVVGSCRCLLALFIDCWPQLLLFVGVQCLLCAVLLFVVCCSMWFVVLCGL